MLENDILLLRKLKKEDLEDVLEYMSSPITLKYFVEGVYDEEKVIKMLNPEKEQEHFGIILKSENKIIGHIDLHDWFMKDTYEIGWMLNDKYFNKGYGFMAAKLVLDHAFSKLKAHRVVATCQPENIASKRICEKLGMRLEGLFIQCIYNPNDNNWWDELFFAILSEEYYEN